jgi:myo-inositol-1(or 4)-monophosphatase
LPEPDLALLEAAARAAGEIALGYAGQPGEVREKPGGHGPVSEADLAVNRMLHARLTAARPDYGWLSEESEDRPARLGARRVFIVDPIDGTRAFIAGQPTWTHSLAVAEAGRVVAGVVHAPMLGLTWAAAAGGGARLNGAPIAASRRDEPDGARLLAAGGQLDPARWPGGVPRFHRGFRPSIALRLCLVADGEADAMLTFRETWEWDVAAGHLIVHEAGGTVSDGRGEAIGYNLPHPALPGIIAAGPALHAALLARLAPT